MSCYVGEMPRPLRYLPPGHLVEITLRTMQGRLLLRPSREVTRTVAGVIGRAQRQTGMEIHAVVCMSNHLHFLLSPDSLEQQARFMNQVGGNIARKVGKIVGWRDRFWGRRYRAIVVSEEEAAQVARLRYLLAHGTKEGLVASPCQWPGVHAASALARGTMQIEGVWRDETSAYRDRQANRKKPHKSYEVKETVHLSQLPCWRHQASEAYRRTVAEMITAIESEARETHRQAESVPLGRQRVLAVDPHATPARYRRSPAPRFHAATLGAQRRLRAGYAAFVACYRRAANAMRRGDVPLSFPSGCFPPAMPFHPG